MLSCGILSSNPVKLQHAVKQIYELYYLILCFGFSRSCRVYNISTKNCIHNISKLSVPSPNSDEKSRSFRMFHDDTMKSFFRRLSFSPDGSLLIVPSGCIEMGEQAMNTTYVFTRASLSK